MKTLTTAALIICLCVNAWSAVAFDAICNADTSTSHCYTAGAGPINNCQITVGATANTVAFLYTWNDTGGIGSVGTPTWGGHAMTLITSHACTNRYAGTCGLWKYLAPSSGLTTLAVTSTSGQAAAVGVTYSGADTVTQPDVFAYQSGSSSSVGGTQQAPLTLTVVAGAWLVGFFGTDTSNINVTPGFGGSVFRLSNVANQQYTWDSGSSQSAGSVSLYANNNSSTTFVYDVLGLSVKPAAASSNVRHRVSQP